MGVLKEGRAASPVQTLFSLPQGKQAVLERTCAWLRSPASTEALDDKVKPIGIPGEAAWPSGKADEYYFVTVCAPRCLGYCASCHCCDAVHVSFLCLGRAVGL